MLGFWDVKGHTNGSIWWRGIDWLKKSNHLFYNFELIFKHKNHLKFHNFCSICSKFTKPSLCTLPSWGLFKSTKSVTKTSTIWEGVITKRHWLVQKINFIILINSPPCWGLSSVTKSTTRYALQRFKSFKEDNMISILVSWDEEVLEYTN